MKKIINKAIHKPVWIIKVLLNIMLSRFAHFIKNDELYLKMRWWANMDYPLNLNNPQTFNEKIQWLKLYNHNPHFTIMVDKVEVKKFMASIIGEKYIIPTIRVYDTPDEIDIEQLPEQFVMKCTHDSADIVICKDKSTIDIDNVKKKFKKGLKRNYYWKTREWPYKNVKPRIIVEKYMFDEGDSPDKDLADYKFMCYNGKCRNIFICTGRSKGDLRVDFFDREWNHLPFIRKYKNADSEPSKPKRFLDMLNIAEMISKKIETSFVRIDLYLINNNIYFGEITFYPGSGLELFTPHCWDSRFGEMISLP